LADELDPVLESALRSVLRAEAASIPFRVRADDLRPTTARTASSGWRPIVLVAATALVGMAIGGVALAGAFHPTERTAPTAVPAGSAVPAPSAMPPGIPGPLAALPSFDRLLGLVEFDGEIGRGEGYAATDTTTVLRATRVAPWEEVLLTCSGPGLELDRSGDGPRTLRPPFDCDGGLQSLPVGWPAPRADGGLTLRVRGGTAWRGVVIGRAEPIAESPAGTGAVSGLPTFDELEALYPRPITELARGSGSAGATDVSFVMPVATVPTGQLEIVLACSPAAAQLSFGTPSQFDVGIGSAVVPCSQDPLHLPFPDTSGAPPWSVVRVRVHAGTSWVAVLVAHAPADPSDVPK
jgi:hypothetical protein